MRLTFRNIKVTLFRFQFSSQHFHRLFSLSAHHQHASGRQQQQHQQYLAISDADRASIDKTSILKFKFEFNLNTFSIQISD